MALAPLNTPYSGSFVEVDHGNYFNFVKLAEPFYDDLRNRFDYKIYVGPNGEETRFANIVKTRAYVAIDEDAFGGFITETWKIRSRRDHETSTL